MVRRTARLSATLTLFASIGLVWLFSACGDDVTVAESREGGPATFPENDAAPVPDANNLISYCPSNKCPAGRTTCPDSHFPCEVDLLSDRANCGACGFACPARTLRETYECIEGKCVLSCNLDNHTLNCDGIPDNGCEIDSYNNNDNCNVCGNKCTDPDKPCVMRERHGNIGCGCLGNDIYCGNSFPPCVDPETDDNNCKQCGNACDPTNGGATMYPHAFYGCAGAECGHLKCENLWGDCDNVMIPNGCETSLFTRQNCGACGNVCPAGQECRPNIDGVPECACPGNLTYCAISRGQGECVDLASSRFNCGACGNTCSNPGIVPPFSITTCNYGTCAIQCIQGRADCNGNVEDDCETNTDADPLNCGGCGVVCDAVAGQACVGGKCVVEPCPVPDGGVTTR